MRTEISTVYTRKKLILAGEGMVCPTEVVAVDGRVAMPDGKEHFSPDHEAVRRRPDLFRPCVASDTRTRDQLRSMQTRAQTSTAKPGERAALPRSPGLRRPVAPWRATSARVPRPPVEAGVVLADVLAATADADELAHLEGDPRHVALCGQRLRGELAPDDAQHCSLCELLWAASWVPN